jgi:hypothetical protein
MKKKDSGYSAARLWQTLGVAARVTGNGYKGRP